MKATGFIDLKRESGAGRYKNEFGACNVWITQVEEDEILEEQGAHLHNRSTLPTSVGGIKAVSLTSGVGAGASQVKGEYGLGSTNYSTDPRQAQFTTSAHGYRIVNRIANRLVNFLTRELKRIVNR